MSAVIGLTTMVGWALGTVEAILISILAGFSVDYVVHLAHAYSHSCGTVDERIVATFSEMGSPVFNGMCTSVLASLPLFACNLQFFFKFGTFLCLTIGFSWVRNPSCAPRTAGGPGVCHALKQHDCCNLHWRACEPALVGLAVVAPLPLTPAPRQMFANFGFMSILASVGTEKRPEKIPDEGQKRRP